MPRFRAALLWMGAVVGRGWVHGHPLQVVAMVAQLAVTYACIVAGLVLLPSWWSFVLIAGPALLAFLWGRVHVNREAFDIQYIFLTIFHVTPF